MPYLQAGTVNFFGFTPAQAVGGEAPCNAYAVSTSAGAILIGDVVVMASTPAGFVKSATIGTSSIVTGATGTTIVGVAAQSVAANAGGTCLVYDDPDQVYVTCDSGGATAGLGSSDNRVLGISYTLNVTSTLGPSGRSSMHFMATGAVLPGGVGDANSRPVLVLRVHPIENLTGTAPYQTASGQTKKWLVKLNGVGNIAAGVQTS